MTTKENAVKWKVSDRYALQYCNADETTKQRKGAVK